MKVGLDQIQANQGGPLVFVQQRGLLGGVAPVLAGVGLLVLFGRSLGQQTQGAQAELSRTFHLQQAAQVFLGQLPLVVAQKLSANPEEFGGLLAWLVTLFQQANQAPGFAGIPTSIGQLGLLQGGKRMQALPG